MQVAEAAQVVAGRPSRGTAEGEVDHHRPGSVAVFGSGPAYARRDRSIGEEPLIEHLGRDVRHDRVACLQFLTAGEPHARRVAVANAHRRHVGAGPQLHAVVTPHGHKRLDQPGGAALDHRDPEPHVAERLEERNRRAAGDVGSEVEVQAPAGEQRSGLRRSQMRVAELTRGGEEQPDELADAVAAQPGQQP